MSFWKKLKFWKKKKTSKKPEIPRLPPVVLSGADAVITTNEVNERHGTGVILQRFFPDSGRILSIRSQSHYKGEQNFGGARIEIFQSGLSRSESLDRVIYALNGASIARIVCVPYTPDDLITALSLQELFNAPLCTYLMDDNNIGSHGITDELMGEALNKSKLRLAISPEFREAYEAKYGERIYLLPPLVNSALLQTTPNFQSNDLFQARTGVLLGNVWSQKWLERLRRTIKESGIRLHWYGNTSAAWLKYTPEELAADGIETRGFLPEQELITRLKTYPYAVIPSGSLDEQDDRPEIARLSQPSRMPYLMAVANIPMVVLGSEQTAAARFVRRFQIGKATPYEGATLRQVIESICDEDEQWFFRRNAAEKGSFFSLDNAGQWIWDSLERGEPVDGKFERLMPREKG
jgi:hypothetical protein